MLSSRLRIILFIAVLSLSWSLIPSKSLRCLHSLHRNCVVPKLDHRQQNPTRPAAISLLAASEVNADVSLNLQPLSRLSPLLKINSLMLFFFATLGSTMPYMPLYYRKIGISDSQIGILSAITPAATFLVSPLWGALADSTGQHKNIMIATFVGSVLLRCFMGSVDKSNVLLLGFIVALSAILFAPVRPLMDSAVLATLEDKSMYGKSRLFGQIGFGLGSFMVGPLLKDAYIKWMFLVQAVLALPTALLMSTMPATVNTTRSTCQVEQKRQTHLQTQELYRLLRDPVVLLFFAAVFLMGLSSGIIENFAFVRVSEVSRGSTAAMSWSRLLSALAGGPMFWLSGRIIKAIGTRAVMVLTLLTYVVRFAMYASITQAWHAIPAEILRGVSFALFWSTATTYVYEKSPQGLSATMLGLLNGIYAGLGQSIGALIGGELVRTMGISAAFYRCATVDGVILLAFLLMHSVVTVVQRQMETSWDVLNETIKLH